MSHPSLGSLQVRHDLGLLRGRPALLQRKWARMAKSSFSFLRGASLLWAHVFRANPSWLRGVPGHGPLVGDLHLENFGTFRTAKGMTFDVNDFDEAHVGSWAFDVTRLMTSVVLARSEFGVSGTAVLGLVDELLDGYDTAMAGGRVPRPSALERLVRQASGARGKVLRKRLLSGAKLLRDPLKTPEAPASVKRLVPAALHEWRDALPPAHNRPTDDALDVLDCTRRVAGTGSLGVERLQVLVRGEKHPWVLTVKEVRGSPAVTTPPSAERLVDLARRCWSEPPVWFGPSHLGSLPVVISRAEAGTDKVSADAYEPSQLGPIARHLGFLTGQLHHRGAKERVRWSAPVRRHLLNVAMELAGLHQQAFLEFCVLARP